MTDQHSDQPIRFRFVLPILSAVSLLLVLSCGGGGGGTEPETVGAVTIYQSDFELPVRAKTQLLVFVADFEGIPLHGVPVTYSSSALQVADVDPQGWVTAIGEGSATITATTEGKSASVRVTVTFLDFVSISAGRSHTCGLLDSGAVRCWGGNDLEQLGLGGAMNGGDYPHPVNTGLSFQDLSAGSDQTCGLTNTGKAYCWGRVGWGASAEGTHEVWNVPQKVPGDLTFQSFRTSGVHMCGLTADGKANAGAQTSLANSESRRKFLTMLLLRCQENSVSVFSLQTVAIPVG